VRREPIEEAAERFLAACATLLRQPDGLV